jgi:hypothetical protein
MRLGAARGKPVFKNRNLFFLVYAMLSFVCLSAKGQARVASAAADVLQSNKYA